MPDSSTEARAAPSPVATVRNASPDDANPPPGEAARAAGRGGLAITFAKVYFIVQGLVQQVLLPRVLGLDGYGRLSSVLSAASIAYNPIVTTSIQGVSRAVAQSEPSAVRATLRRTFVVHAALAVSAATAFFLSAPLVSGFMRAPHITPALELVSLVLLFYGLYSPLVGALNGGRRFVAQASFDVAFATIRTAALVAGGALLAPSGRGVVGSVSGFVLVSAAIFVGALVVVGVGARGPGAPEVGKHVSFVAPLFAGQILLNLLLQADLTLLRRFAGEAAESAGLTHSAADPLVGAYRATQLYSFLPYQLLVSVTVILFPLLAVAARAGDRAAVARYVATGVRLAMIVAGLLVGVTSGLSSALLELVYTHEAAALGGRAMQILTLGFGAFAILGVLTSVLSSLGKEREGAGVVAVAFTLVVVLGFTVTRGAPFGEELLFRTAVSTSAGLVVATAWAAVLVRRAAGAVVAPVTAVRVVVSLAITVTLARYLPAGGKVWTVAASAVTASVYVVLLLLTGELGRRDLETLKLVVLRRRNA